MRVFLNDRVIHATDMQWNPDRVGAYTFEVPAEAVRPGANRLAVFAEAPGGAPASVRFWYARLHP